MLLKLLILIFCCFMLTFSTSALIEFFCSRPIYDESVWNNKKIVNKNNCWMYAVNKPKLNLKMKSLQILILMISS